MVNYLNEIGLAARGVARGNVPGADQWHSMIYASTVDLKEAYKVEQKAVQIAMEDASGYMATILREAGRTYSIHYDKLPVELVVNSERNLPEIWIRHNRLDVTDFIRFATPLIGEAWPEIAMHKGRQRAA